MNEKHYSEQLTKFLDHELSPDERLKIGEHLLHCRECRQTHDLLKSGIELVRTLDRADAPRRVWNNIESVLNDQNHPAQTAFFSLRNPAFTVLSAVVVFGLTAIIYFGFLNSKPFETAETKSEIPLNEKQIEKQAAWQVENTSGGGATENELLKVGGILETDENSRAKIEVADIGQVEIAPNSLVKLVNTSETEHRLALEYGELEAKIFAPPRLFVVDTPTAQAVDLGCSYKLEVDKAGNSRLHVTSGYVALERDGRESIVPAGAVCLTRRGKGIGTPFFETASAKFKDALRKFDFETGGEKHLDSIIEKAKAKDTLTLWHLLSRVSENEREKLFNKIHQFAKLPYGVNREGILEGDKKMLEEWRYEIELNWYE